MQSSLVYAIKYVADMNKAVAFYRDKLGLKVRFESPGWSEFETGATTLALHHASPENPAGTCSLGFRTPGLHAAYAEREALGLSFKGPPKALHGTDIAQIFDSEGAEISVSDAPG
jgi:catechol 2,3-dioxygenase-like lactoylglutathione lyase family enzyme